MPKTYFVIKSVNEERREVGGLITCEKIDKDGEILDYTGSKPHFEAWSAEANNATKTAGQEPSWGNVREQHSKRVAGKFNAPLVFDDAAKTIWGQAKIYDDDIWEKVKDGVYSGFSVGGSLAGPIKTVGKKRFITIIPREVSLVDNPAVDSAHFDFIRAADGSVVQKSFKHASAKQRLKDAVEMLQEVLDSANDYADEGADPAYAPDAVPDQNGRSQPVEQGPDAHGTQPGDRTTKAPITPPIEAQRPFGNSDTQLGDTDSEPKADMIANDTTKVVAADPLVPEVTKHDHADEPATMGTAITPDPMIEVTDEGHQLEQFGLDSDKPDPENLEKRAVSDKERADLADKGHAMPDGSYPIANKSDLSNAVQAFGRAKNPSAVKAHIKKRAAALGAENLLPDTWKATKSQLSKVVIGAQNMPSEIEKAARLGLTGHLQNLKALASKHAKAAADHEVAVHEACDKCMKLAGPAFDADEEHEGGQDVAVGDSEASQDTEVKSAKAEIEKLSKLVLTLTEKVEAFSKPAEVAKTVAAVTVVGDPAKAVANGTTEKPTVEKLAAETKEQEALLTLMKAAQGIGVDGKRIAPDPKAMETLYDKLTNGKEYVRSNRLRITTAKA